MDGWSLSVSLHYTIHYRELDELEREDFTRLKMVKRKKEEAQKLLDKEREIEKAAAASAKEARSAEAAPEGKANKNLLSSFNPTDDSDVVFK